MLLGRHIDCCTSPVRVADVATLLPYRGAVDFLQHLPSVSPQSADKLYQFPAPTDGMNCHLMRLCFCHICSVRLGLPATSLDISIPLFISGPSHLTHEILMWI